MDSIVKLALAVVAGIIGAVIVIGAHILGWCLRHPVFAGFVIVSIIAASFGVWWLIAWWALCALVLAGLGIERTPANDGVLVWGLAAICRMVWWLARHPFAIGLAGLSIWFMHQTSSKDWATGPMASHAGVIALVALWSWFGVLAWLWHDMWPTSFENQVARRARSSWRSLIVYWPRWNRTLRGIHELTKILDDDRTRVTPRRLKTTSGPWADTVRAELIEGQSPQQWEKAADQLAASFGAIDCRIRRLDPRTHAVDLVLRHKDPLAQTQLPNTKPAEGIDLERLEVATSETGDPFPIAVIGGHLLVAGATGSGKGSVVGSILNATAPLNPQGLVRLVGVDLKRGMELAMYGDPHNPDQGGLWWDLAYTPKDAVELLEVLVDEEQTRADRLRGVARHFELSTSDPLWLIFIDELAELIYYQPDKGLKRDAQQAISTLAAEGRAPGFSLICATQDPRKEIVQFRDLLVPNRIGLRLPDPDITDAVLGDGAYDRGAWCDRIPTETPGVGYIWIAGQPQPERIRFPWVDDTRAQWLADTYPPQTRRFITTTATPVEDVVVDDDQDPDDTAWAA